MSQSHELKTAAAYWDAVSREEKTFEVRRDDRGFQKGDLLILLRMREDRPTIYDISPAGSKRRLERRISYILTGGQFGVEPGYVVMGLKK